MTTSSGSYSSTNSRACAIAPSTSSSRSCDGPGRFSSGLCDIQHRASVTLEITPSRREGEGVQQRGAQLGRELSDTRPRDAPVGAQEQYRFRVGVEPGLNDTAPIPY